MLAAINRSSDLVEVRPSGIHGRGVFATRPIRKGKRIIEYTGKRVLWESVPDDPNDPRTFLFGLYNGKDVIDATVGGNEACWINHSCEPNAYMKILYGHILFMALRDINPGEEITIDYQSTLHSDRKRCSCGAPSCRGTINKV